MSFVDKLLGKAKKALTETTQPVTGAVKSGAEDLSATLRTAKEAALKAVPVIGPKPSTEVSKKPSQG